MKFARQPFHPLKHGGAGEDLVLGAFAVDLEEFAAANGVAFESIDGEPVYVFVLLVSPQDRPGDHLRALENVVRSMRDDGFVRKLRDANSREAIWAQLEDPAH